MFKFTSGLQSGEGLTIRATLNVLAVSSDRAARFVIGLLINPLLVSGLGTTLFGVWEILRRLIGYLSAASGRPAPALRMIIANRQSSKDYHEKRCLVGSAVAVWFLFLPLLGLTGGLLTWLIPPLLEVTPHDLWTVRLAILLLAANVTILSLAGISRAVLNGENLGYKRIGLSALLIFSGGGLTALALYLELGLIGVVVATLTTTCLTGLTFLFIVRSFVPWFGFAPPRRSAFGWFLGLSWWFLLWNFVMRLTMSSDFIVLGFFDSVELVASYSLTRYMPDSIFTLVAAALSGALPGIGRVIGGQQWKKATRVRGELMTFSWLLGTAVGCTILLWNPSFVSLWVGPGYDAGAVPTFLIVVMVLQLTLIQNDARIIDVTLDVRRKVLLGLLSVALSITLAAFLVGPRGLGIVGLCLGFIGGRILLTFAYPWLVGQVLGIPLLSQLRAAWRPTVTTGLLFLAASAGRESLTVDTWFSLVISTAATALLATALAIVLGLTDAQRLSLWRRLQVLGKSIYPRQPE